MKSSKLYKGSLTTIILKLLSEYDKMYGYEITQKVKAITAGELQITEGALYPSLHKLEAEGFLEVEFVKVSNRTRKYYKLTEQGAKEADDKLEALRSYMETMKAFLYPKFELE